MRVLGVTGVVISLVGCLQQNKQAVERCEALVRATCADVEQCGFTNPANACFVQLNGFGNGRTCADAVGTDDRYDGCVAELLEQGCSTGTEEAGVQVPRSCERVILFE